MCSIFLRDNFWRARERECVGFFLNAYVWTSHHSTVCYYYLHSLKKESLKPNNLYNFCIQLLILLCYLSVDLLVFPFMTTTLNKTKQKNHKRKIVSLQYNYFDNIQSKSNNKSASLEQTCQFFFIKFEQTISLIPHQPPLNFINPNSKRIFIDSFIYFFFPWTEFPFSLLFFSTILFRIYFLR